MVWEVVGVTILILGFHQRRTNFREALPTLSLKVSTKELPNFIHILRGRSSLLKLESYGMVLPLGIGLNSPLYQS